MKASIDFLLIIPDNKTMRLYDYLLAGGPLMVILLVLNVVGFALMISKFIVFTRQGRHLEEMISPLSEGVKQKSGAKEASAVIELAKQELRPSILRLEKGLNTIKIIASVAPLLGLMGTVIGVLLSFQTMADQGPQGPHVFARGISMALITTVGGLVVAIPHFIGHNYLIGMLDTIESRLEREIIKEVL